MGLTAEQIADLKRQHGDKLIALDYPTEMIFKKPPRAAWADFQDSVAKDKGSREGAYRRLCISSIVYPTRGDDILPVFDEFPALPTKIGEALSSMIGLGDDFDVKKL